MHGVGAQRHDRFVASPERQRLQPGIDRPLLAVARQDVLRRRAGAVVGNGSVRQVIAPVRGHSLHLRLPDPQPRDGPAFWQRLADGPADALHGLLMKGEVADTVVQPVRLHQPLRREIDHRRLMLVHGAHEHAIWRGARRLRQHLAPARVGIVANLAPVDRHKHDRRPAAEEHDALGVKRVHDHRGIKVAAADHRVARRDRHIRAEGRDREPGAGGPDGSGARREHGEPKQGGSKRQSQGVHGSAQSNEFPAAGKPGALGKWRRRNSESRIVVLPTVRP